MKAFRTTREGEKERRREREAERGKPRASFSLPLFLSFPLSLCLALVLSLAGCRSRDSLLTQAQAAWDRSDFQAAVTKYEEYLKNAPSPEQAANVHFEAARVYYLNLKQYDRAAEHYIRLIEDFPQFPKREQAYHQLAECFELMKKPREAISEYESLLIAFPETSDRRKVRLAIADLYNDYDQSQALVEYQKVVKDAPYDELSEKAYLRIGGVRYVRESFEEAIPAYQAVADSTKDAVIRRQARERLADCYEGMVNYDKACEILEKTEPDPKDPEYLHKKIEGIRSRQRTRRLIQPVPTPEQKK